MHLIAVGRTRPGPESALFDRYNARLRPTLQLIQVPEARGPVPVVKRKEGLALLATVSKTTFVVPLDLGGALLNSEELAVHLDHWSHLARPVAFLIGGAEGLDTAVIARADFVLSLGRMTWPHLLVRAMLVEQLYRAQAIHQRHPYHRAGRPEG